MLSFDIRSLTERAVTVSDELSPDDEVWLESDQKPSAPCMPLLLEREGAVAALREAIGATDPAEAAPGTIRKLYAESKGRNAIHASDSDENATREARFFFAETELLWG